MRGDFVYPIDRKPALKKLRFPNWTRFRTMLFSGCVAGVGIGVVMGTIVARRLVREVVGCVLRDGSGLLSEGRIDGVIIEGAEKHTYPQTHIWGLFICGKYPPPLPARPCAVR